MDEQALWLLLKEHYDGLLSQLTTCFTDLGFIYAVKSSGACEKRRVLEETTFHEVNKLDLGFDSGDNSVMERTKNDRDQKAIDHQTESQSFNCATSWDNQIRCWEVTKNGTSVSSVARESIAHDKSVLSSAWKDDG
nr:protein RAE1-like [Tanacetum cinerariifolium]